MQSDRSKCVRMQMTAPMPAPKMLATAVQQSLTRISVETLLIACMATALPATTHILFAVTDRTEDIHPTSSEAEHSPIPTYDSHDIRALVRGQGRGSACPRTGTLGSSPDRAFR